MYFTFQSEMVQFMILNFLPWIFVLQARIKVKNLIEGFIYVSRHKFPKLRSKKLYFLYLINLKFNFTCLNLQNKIVLLLKLSRLTCFDYLVRMKICVFRKQFLIINKFRVWKFLHVKSKTRFFIDFF
jgi:hypothetical protein